MNGVFLQLGIDGIISGFIESDLKPILGAIVLAGLILVILFNVNKLFQDNGWKQFILIVGGYILIAVALGAVLVGAQSLISSAF